ncbi:hypothetical protein ACIP9X_14500 [Arthrobacter sp. NPDC093125]|uniref:hypothetical protein n=1 Tax=Arthrobacter sp. NPDC093125 TaxID=3363944 RepID=UPI0038259B92
MATGVWGQGFAFALQSDGTVWTWGANSESQLGQGGGFVGPGTPESIGIPLPTRIQLPGAWLHWRSVWKPQRY